jgi:predicted nucleic acid-binding protein
VPDQQDAIEALMRSQPRLAVQDAAVIEAVFVLERVLRLSRKLIGSALTRLMAEPAVIMDRVLWTRVLDLYAAHPKLSIVDVYLATAAARGDDLPLFTFDAKMISQLSAADSPPSSPAP